MKKEKSIDLAPIDVDETGKVVTVWSKMDVIDHDGDVITRSAFTKTLGERGPKGKNLIYHLTDHSWKFSESFIGKPTELYVSGDQLISVTEIDLVTNPHGKFMHARYMKGDVNQHSIGFSVVKGEPITAQTGNYYEISEVKLREGSAVLWGANEFTGTIEAKYEEHPELILAEIKGTIAEFKKYINKGLNIDETYCFAMHLEEQYSKYNKITQPQTVTEPKMKDAEIIELFSNIKFH